MSDQVKLDDGAAVVFLGTEDCYQNYSSVHGMPLWSAREIEQLVANGTMDLIVVDEDSVEGNVGILGGQDDEEPVEPISEETPKQSSVLEF